MSEIKFNYKNDQFQLEGFEGEIFEYKEDFPKKSSIKTANFYRIDDNFGYVYGKINFSNDCNNNVVISDQINTTISKTRNSLIIINNKEIRISPIQKVEISYLRCAELLKEKSIIYNIPQKVLKREKLKRKNRGELEKILIENYHFPLVELKEIEGSIKRNGIFYISDGNNKYIFKYIGEDKKRIKAISEVMKTMPNLFPIIKETVNGERGVSLEDGIYGLEEFIDGKQDIKRDLRYFTKLGRYMAIMHERLLTLVEDNPDLKKEFLIDNRYLSESNLVSLGIDLTLAGFKDINSKINQFARLELNKKVDSLPEYLIHGDLNGSNVIVTPKRFRFIDLERIKISKRVLELESPLIFGGNMAVPVYLEGSIKSLIEGYNISAKYPISNDEYRLSIDLIKYALVKNFVIRNIRRGEKNNTKENLLENLYLLNKESFENR